MFSPVSSAAASPLSSQQTVSAKMISTTRCVDIDVVLDDLEDAAERKKGKWTSCANWEGSSCGCMSAVSAIVCCSQFRSSILAVHLWGRTPKWDFRYLGFLPMIPKVPNRSQGSTAIFYPVGWVGRWVGGGREGGWKGEEALSHWRPVTRSQYRAGRSQVCQATQQWLLG